MKVILDNQHTLARGESRDCANVVTELGGLDKLSGQKQLARLLMCRGVKAVA